MLRVLEAVAQEVKVAPLFHHFCLMFFAFFLIEFFISYQPNVLFLNFFPFPASQMYSNLGTYLEKEVAKGLNDLRKDWLVELERIEKKSANIKNIVFSTVENFLEV